MLADERCERFDGRASSVAGRAERTSSSRAAPCESRRSDETSAPPSGCPSVSAEPSPPAPDSAHRQVCGAHENGKHCEHMRAAEECSSWQGPLGFVFPQVTVVPVPAAGHGGQRPVVSTAPRSRTGPPTFPRAARRQQPSVRQAFEAGSFSAVPGAPAESATATGGRRGVLGASAFRTRPGSLPGPPARGRRDPRRAG